jgi:uncharacterized protein YabN with tetrapyrrole methylase and pyrophosphatase domain
MAAENNNPLDELIKLIEDASAYGFVWPDQDSVIDHVISECYEIKDAIRLGEGRDRVQEEIGDLIHTAIFLCIFSGLQVGETIEAINHKFYKRMVALKAIAAEHGLENLHNQPTNFMLELWRQAKNCTVD